MVGARRIEPATLIQQTTEPESVDAILLERIFVVNAGDEPFVRDEQEREARSLINPAALRLDDAILDLVRHAQPMPPADRIRFQHQRELLAPFPGFRVLHLHHHANTNDPTEGPDYWVKSPTWIGNVLKSLVIQLMYILHLWKIARDWRTKRAFM